VREGGREGWRESARKRTRESERMSFESLPNTDTISDLIPCVSYHVSDVIRCVSYDIRSHTMCLIPYQMSYDAFR